MKLAFLTDDVSRHAGGLFDAVRRLAQSLVKPNTEVRVFGIAGDDASEAVASWQPVPVQLSQGLGPRSFGFAPQLFSMIRDFAPDALMPQGLWKYSSVASLQWTRRTGRPCLIHPHGMLDPWAVRNSAWKKRVAGLLYENANLRRAACLRALCESEAQAMRAFGLRNPICVIPNGMDLPPIESGKRKAESGNPAGATTGTREHGTAGPAKAESKKQKAEMGRETDSQLSTFNFQLSALAPSGRKTLLYLGRLHPKKNLGPLLRAWAEVQRGHAAARDWTLAIAGWDQGGYEGELRKLAGELGLAQPNKETAKAESRKDAEIPTPGFQLSTFNFQLSSVQFLGPQFNDAKAACYANCDAFILPSLSEGLPMVVLEAWAYAKPVLMTDECNLPEGFAAQAALRIGTDAPGIAAGLCALLDMTAAERAAMGARGRELVATKFSWPTIAAEMRRVCEWTLGGGTPPESVRLYKS